MIGARADESAINGITWKTSSCEETRAGRQRRLAWGVNAGTVDLRGQIDCLAA
jgi:hypothetical protein